MIIKVLSTAFGWSIGSYWLLITPRLVMTALSLLVDLLLFKMCKAMKVNGWSCLSMFGCSYLTLVHQTHTLSNSTETVIFAIMIYIVVKSTSQRQQKVLNMGDDIFKECLCMGVLLVAGTYNRPTFLLFAVSPCLYWLTQKIEHGLLNTIFIFLNCLPWMVLITIMFAVFDSMYYGTLSKDWIVQVTDIQTWPAPLLEILRNLTFTPLNFVKYNLKANNLASHGLHPKYMHFLVNFPLLFGLVAPACVVFSLKRLSQTKCFRSNNSQTKMLLLLSLWIPLLLLSIFPHQEARFLIPLIIPLVLLMHDHVLGARVLSLLKWSWIIWNVLGCVMIGFFHQGGITKSLMYLSNEINVSSSGIGHANHIVFFHTYMPPRYLLQIKKDQEHSETVVHDIAGASAQELEETLKAISKKHEVATTTKTLKIFVVLPSTDKETAERVIMKNPGYKILQFYPHLSMEDPPNLLGLLIDCKEIWLKTSEHESFLQVIGRILQKCTELLSLNVIILN